MTADQPSPTRAPDEARHTHAGVRREHEHLGYPSHEHVWITREDANEERAAERVRHPSPDEARDREPLDAAWERLVDALGDGNGWEDPYTVVTKHRPLIEASLRAAALGEARERVAALERVAVAAQTLSTVGCVNGFGVLGAANLEALNDLDAALAALAALTPDGSQPVHRHIPEWPSTCTGCEHLAADLVARAPEWMLVKP